MAKTTTTAPEYRAEAKFQRVSPQKAKLVLDLIKGKPVGQAINIVAFTNKRIASGDREDTALGGAERAVPGG